MAEITYYVALPFVAATTHVIGGWERDWTQIVGFNDTAGNPFCFFIRKELPTLRRLSKAHQARRTASQS
jgi:hypothetical protein